MGVPPVRCTGRIQKRVRRALTESNGRPLLTIDLLEHAYPRVAPPYERWRYTAVYRAATRFAARVGGPGRAFIIWGPNRELAERLAEDAFAEGD
jgi:hypothetical protein